MRPLIRLLLVAASTLGLVACGGAAQAPEPGSAPATTSEQVIPTALFIARADAICRASHASLAVALSKSPPSRNAAAGIASLAPSFEINADAARSEVSKIMALGRPRRRADVLTDYLDQRTTGANALVASAAAARKGDLAAMEANLGQVDSRRAIALAKRFGFRSCAGASLQAPA